MHVFLRAGLPLILSVLGTACAVVAGSIGAARANSDTLACANAKLPAATRATACTEALGRTRRDDARAELLIRRGQARLERHQMQDALEDFAQAIGLDQGPAEAYHGRGLARFALGRYEAAIRDFDAAVAREFGLAAAYYDRAHAHQALGRLEQAERDFATVIELRPGSAAGFFGRARLRYLARRHWLAFRDINRAVDLEPENGFGILWRYLAIMRLNAAGQRMKMPAAQADGWPGALLEMLAGRADLAMTLRIAHAAEPGALGDRECATYFYAGQMAELSGAPDKAMDYYRHAVARGRPALFECMASAQVLRQLEAAQSLRDAR